MATYPSRPVSAPWIKCKVCNVKATMAITVKPEGKHSRRGSRTLGYYCSEHGRIKLVELRSKRR